MSELVMRVADPNEESFWCAADFQGLSFDAERLEDRGWDVRCHVEGATAYIGCDTMADAAREIRDAAHELGSAAGVRVIDPTMPFGDFRFTEVWV